MDLEADSALRFGERNMPINTNTIVELTEKHSAQIEDGVITSLKAFGANEKTLAVLATGLPTLVARADCTVDPETGDIHLFEAEERPAGIGVIDALGQQIANRKLGSVVLNHMEHILGKVPVVKRHIDVHENDDGLLMEVQTFSDRKMKLQSNQPILVRAEPHQMTEHPRLEDATNLAIAPIVEKGKRSYRIVTGHANLVTNPKALPVDQSLVIKTLQGSKARGVAVHLTAEDTILHGKTDTVSHIKASNIVRKEGAVIVEKFIPAIPVNMNAHEMGRMILRVLCLIDQNGAKAIGGAFIARPGHIVHGQPDAISGLVLSHRLESL